jgi:acetolactate synthase-1/2/3 large subunit
MPEQHPLNLGRFGTHGMRHTNFAVQNADFILSLGSRLDTKATGSPVNTFARAAYKVMVDIDSHELTKFDKFNMHLDLKLQTDLGDFFNRFTIEELLQAKCATESWLSKTIAWKNTFTTFDANHRFTLMNGVNPYRLFNELSEKVTADALVMIDTGCSIAWSMQAWQLKRGQRLFHDFNNTAMGWALPAANGAWFASGGKKAVLCIVGDGSLMMSIQELATSRHHSIPVKIILVNNSGYAMIRQTQDQWLNSDYIASSKQGGITFPNFSNISEAFGLDYVCIDTDDTLAENLERVIAHPRAVLCEVIVSAAARVIPQVKYGHPNEDMEPLISRDLLARETLI